MPRPARVADPTRVALTAALLALAVIWLLPIVWVLVTSLKPTENIVRVPPEWIPWPATADHYGEVLFSSSRTARIGRAFANSLVIALGTVAIVLLTSAMAAYALARLRFPGRGVVFALFIGSLMVPNAVVLVPQYVLTQRLGWLSTYQGLIVPEAATSFAFGVFLLRQFFLTIPEEYLDAARVDELDPATRLASWYAHEIAGQPGDVRVDTGQLLERAGQVGVRRDRADGGEPDVGGSHDRRQRGGVRRPRRISPAVPVRDHFDARDLRVLRPDRAHPGRDRAGLLDRAAAHQWMAHCERLSDGARRNWRRSVVRSHRRIPGRNGASVTVSTADKPAPVKASVPAPEKPSSIIDGVSTRMRLDRLLFEKGLFESREKAQRAIMAGEQTIGDFVLINALLREKLRSSD